METSLMFSYLKLRCGDIFNVLMFKQISSAAFNGGSAVFFWNPQLMGTPLQLHRICLIKCTLITLNGFFSSHHCFVEDWKFNTKGAIGLFFLFQTSASPWLTQILWLWVRLWEVEKKLRNFAKIHLENLGCLLSTVLKAVSEWVCTFCRWK